MEKSSCFEMKRGIKICSSKSFTEKLSGNNLAIFQPNWSLPAVDLELKTYVQLTKIFIWRKKETTFSADLASNEIKTPTCLVSHILVDTREGSALISLTIQL